MQTLQSILRELRAEPVPDIRCYQSKTAITFLIPNPHRGIENGFSRRTQARVRMAAKASGYAVTCRTTGTGGVFVNVYNLTTVTRAELLHTD